MTRLTEWVHFVQVATVTSLISVTWPTLGDDLSGDSSPIRLGFEPFMKVSNGTAVPFGVYIHGVTRET